MYTAQLDYLQHVPQLTHRIGVPAVNTGVVVVHKGLSVVTACGHVVDLVRDEANKIATVRVTSADPNKHVVQTPTLLHAVDTLAARAKRFLGEQWEVVLWSTPIETAQESLPLPEPKPRKVAGKTDPKWGIS